MVSYNDGSLGNKHNLISENANSNSKCWFFGDSYLLQSDMEYF